jgi:hypothetical protein
MPAKLLRKTARTGHNDSLAIGRHRQHPSARKSVADDPYALVRAVEEAVPVVQVEVEEPTKTIAEAH